MIIYRTHVYIDLYRWFIDRILLLEHAIVPTILYTFIAYVYIRNAYLSMPFIILVLRFFWTVAGHPRKKAIHWCYGRRNWRWEEEPDQHVRLRWLVHCQAPQTRNWKPTWHSCGSWSSHRSVQGRPGSEEQFRHWPFYPFFEYSKFGG